MSRYAWRALVVSGRFPRVSGDEPSNKGYAPVLILFSPRERG